MTDPRPAFLRGGDGAIKSGGTITGSPAKTVVGDIDHDDFDRSPQEELARAAAARLKRGANGHEEWSYEPPSAPWPAPLAADAFHGLAGNVVLTLGPHTEADPAAILLQFLAAFGNAAGRHSFVQVEGDRHPPQIWPVLVGETAKARKGTSWGRIRRIFAEACPEWAGDRVVSGLSSGEGVIWQVRDPISSTSTDKKTGERTETETDPGVDDKRLLVLEAEFASPLRHMERAGNTLSSTLRTLWDTGTVSSLTKNSPAKATGSMVTIIGHITVDELKRYLTATERGNGLANRFLFVGVRRSKKLPFGGGDVDMGPIVLELRRLLNRIIGDRPIGWGRSAIPIWEEAYDDLSEGRAGLVGAITSRAEAQVLRLALTYALLDDSATIEADHLNAALAVWRYCDESVTCIFGKSTGDPLADEIERMLRRTPTGLTRTDISNLLGRHHSAAGIGGALGALLKAGLARSETRPTGGRPEERWFTTDAN